MELQGGLLGWQVETLTKTHPAGHGVTVRMGPFFRLKLSIDEDGAMTGALELTQPGGHPLIAWRLCLVSVRDQSFNIRKSSGHVL